jgi:hypothetical protein
MAGRDEGRLARGQLAKQPAGLPAIRVIERRRARDAQ